MPQSDPETASLASTRQDVKTTVQTLIALAHKLLEELDLLQSAVERKGRICTTAGCDDGPVDGKHKALQDYGIDTRHFRKGVLAELKPLEKLDAAFDSISSELDRLGDRLVYKR